jgi:protein-export membrane protein SecD
MLKFLAATALGLLVFAARAAEAPVRFHAVLELNVQAVWHDEMERYFDDLKRRLDDGRIAYTDMTNQDGRVTVGIADPEARAEIIAAMTLNPTREKVRIVVAAEGADRVTLAPRPEYRRETERALLAQTLEVVSRRLEFLNHAQLTVRAAGRNRIGVEITGPFDHERFTALFAAAPILTVNLVDDTISPAALQQGVAPPGETILPQEAGPGGAPQRLAVRTEPLLKGERISWAQNGLEDGSREPIVTIHLDGEGAMIFAGVTRAHVMHRIAVVLDGRIVLAPIIYEPITGGSLQISGGFTTAQALDLAARLSRGGIPAPLRIVEAGAGPLPH